MVKGITLINKYGNMKAAVVLTEEYQSIADVPLCIMDFVNSVAAENDYSFGIANTSEWFNGTNAVLIPEGAICQ